jgi:hypothetical protein
MTLCVLFGDKAKPPAESELTKALGRAGALWDELKRRIAAAHSPIDEQWVFSGKNCGWSLRLKQKKRAVVYFTPKEGWFRAAFALGEKAVAAAHKGDLPASVLTIIDQAPRFAEGRGVRIEVRSLQDVAVVEKLAAIKMAN